MRYCGDDEPNRFEPAQTTLVTKTMTTRTARSFDLPRTRRTRNQVRFVNAEHLGRTDRPELRHNFFARAGAR